MSKRRGLEAGVALSLILAACARPLQAVDNTPNPTGNATAEAIVTNEDPFLDEGEATAEPAQLPTEMPRQDPTATSLPPVETQVAGGGDEAAPDEPLVNPFAGHVFVQRCKINDGGAGKWIFNCVEKWAEKPLPGGCLNPVKNYLGSSTCNSAATSFVINQMVPPEVIKKVVGVPGIDPELLVYGVYQNLRDGLGFKMDCNGAGFEIVIPTLETFGLTATKVDKLSWWTLPDFVENLKPGQTLMVSMIGINAKGKRFQHYTVARDVITMPDGTRRVRFYDSYFFPDPENPNPDSVIFADSPNISNDPSSPIGKRVDIVGAVIFEATDFSQVTKLIDASLIFRDDEPGVDYQMEYATDRDEFLVTDRGLEDADLYFLGEPVAVGPNRYRIKVNYRGEGFDYYYYDPYGGVDLPDLNQLIWYRWGGYLIPLLKQTDPEWAALPIKKKSVDGVTYPFGKRGCGQAVAGSLLSMVPVGGQADFFTPYDVYETYFPDLDGGRGTYPKDYVPIFESAGFTVEQIGRSKAAIMEAVMSGKLAVVQGGVDFKWGGANDGRVNHFVLVFPPGEDGRVQIFDPVWGVGVTELDDIDFSQSLGVMAISAPSN